MKNMTIPLITNRLSCVCIVAVMLSSMAGCKRDLNGVGSNSENPATQPEDNKSLVLKMYAEFDKGKLADFAQHISPDFKCNVLGNTDLDWEGFIQFGNGFLSAFPDGKHNFNHVIVEGENVVTIGTYTGTHVKDMNGIAPTNATIALSVMHLDRVVDGKIVEHRGIANQVQFMNQLGFEMIPKKI